VSRVSRLIAAVEAGSAMQEARPDPHDRLIEGKLTKLGAGLNVTAEIMTGKRRAIDYLLSPVRMATQESLTERQ
jgi:hypothetical protein